MASDLESLYDHYRRLGHDEAGAIRLAQDRLLTSTEALRGLIALHTTGYERLATMVMGRLRWGFDALLFIVGVAPLLLASAYVVGVEVVTGEGGPLRWVILLLGGIVGGLSVWKVYALAGHRGYSASELGGGLFSLLFLGVVAPIIGGGGFLLALARIGTGVSRNPSIEVRTAAESIAASGTDFALSILVSIAAAMVWFILVNRIGDIEREESRVLLAVTG